MIFAWVDFRLANVAAHSMRDSRLFCHAKAGSIEGGASAGSLYMFDYALLRCRRDGASDFDATILLPRFGFEEDTANNMDAR